MTDTRFFKNGVERAIVIGMTQSGGDDQVAYVAGMGTGSAAPVVVGKNPVVWHLIFDRLFLRDTRDMLTAVYELRSGPSTIPIKVVSCHVQGGISGAVVVPMGG